MCTVDSDQQFLILCCIQSLSLPQLHATRAISGYSVPIIPCVETGAGVILRLFGPESMGGIGDLGAKIDAEIARTGLSDEEIGPKVCNMF